MSEPLTIISGPPRSNCFYFNDGSVVVWSKHHSRQMTNNRWRPVVAKKRIKLINAHIAARRLRGEL